MYIEKVTWSLCAVSRYSFYTIITFAYSFSSIFFSLSLSFNMTWQKKLLKIQNWKKIKEKIKFCPTFLNGFLAVAFKSFLSRIITTRRHARRWSWIMQMELLWSLFLISLIMHLSGEYFYVRNRSIGAIGSDGARKRKIGLGLASWIRLGLNLVIKLMFVSLN